MLEASANVKLEVELGEEPGSSDYTLYLMSDSHQADSINTCQCKKSRDVQLMNKILCTTVFLAFVRAATRSTTSS